jgi:hypothetical protein
MHTADNHTGFLLAAANLAGEQAVKDLKENPDVVRAWFTIQVLDAGRTVQLNIHHERRPTDDRTATSP